MLQSVRKRYIFRENMLKTRKPQANNYACIMYT